ncbi:Flagellar motor switch protein FliN [Halomonas sp. THAF12]|uniref:flagellar motor switch protein FliN n=1 Tax=Halomonas sp. THAF12 TaxID=2587849 RepID=UPI00126809B1|nr:flagellar motor switch protein FliN [Halomonas sp. THAF12]QFT86640.1 Flagellar motor switch protein FliN [Halomonas sp. THAF12]
MTDPNKPDDQNLDDEWAAAMSEQEGSATPSEDDDPWAAAMAEQAAAEEAEGDETPEPDGGAEAQPASGSVFQPLEGAQSRAVPRDLEMIMDIPVKLTVELGRTKLTIKQLLELAQGSVIELEGLAGEPMDILINGYLIAQGEVVVVDDKYGIRITEIITPSERVQKLNR